MDDDALLAYNVVVVLATTLLVVGLAYAGEPWGWGFLMLMASRRPD